MIWYFLIAVLIVFLQAVFLPLNLVVLWLVGGLSYFPTESWALLAFVLGVVFDLVSGRLWGMSALLFLGLVLVALLYSRKWSLGHPVVCFFLAVVGDVVCRWFWGTPISPVEVLLVGLLAGLWGWWLRSYQGGSGKIKLRV